MELPAEVSLVVALDARRERGNVFAQCCSVVAVPATLVLFLLFRRGPIYACSGVIGPLILMQWYPAGRPAPGLRRASAARSVPEYVLLYHASIAIEIPLRYQYPEPGPTAVVPTLHCPAPRSLGRT